MKLFMIIWANRKNTVVANRLLADMYIYYIIPGKKIKILENEIRTIFLFEDSIIFLTLFDT